MGQPGRLWQALSTATAQHPGDCGCQFYLVPYRDIEWRYAFLGAQHCPDHFPLILEICPGTWLSSHRAVLAAETRLGAAQGWRTQQQTQMRGQAKPPGMGDALAIYQEEVGDSLKALAGR